MRWVTTHGRFSVEVDVDVHVRPDGLKRESPRFLDVWSLCFSRWDSGMGCGGCGAWTLCKGVGEGVASKFESTSKGIGIAWLGFERDAWLCVRVGDVEE